MLLRFLQWSTGLYLSVIFYVPRRLGVFVYALTRLSWSLLALVSSLGLGYLRSLLTSFRNVRLLHSSRGVRSGKSAASGGARSGTRSFISHGGAHNSLGRSKLRKTLESPPISTMGGTAVPTRTTDDKPLTTKQRTPANADAANRLSAPANSVTERRRRRRARAAAMEAKAEAVEAAAARRSRDHVVSAEPRTSAPHHTTSVPAFGETLADVNPLVNIRRRRTVARNTRTTRRSASQEHYPPAKSFDTSAADAADAAAKAGMRYVDAIAAQSMRTSLPATPLSANNTATPAVATPATPNLSTPGINSVAVDDKAAAALAKWAKSLRRAAHASACVLAVALAWFYRTTSEREADAAWSTRLERKLLLVALLPAAQLYANAVRGTLGKVDSAPVQRVVTSVAVNWFIVGFIASMKLSESI